ncbi:hypothetical protein G6F56_003969 [Rhizopus delemar]|nr:hypothetical protein G6F56_003969 [Rhizopus delemar]
MENTNVLSYILSFIGFRTTKTITNTPTSDCSFLTASTFIVSEDEKILIKSPYNENVVQNWLNQLSNATLCQILSSAISDYPQISDTIRAYYFGTQKNNGWLPELICLRERAHKVSHSLDQYRISDQFSRASEVAVSLHLLLCQFTQQIRGSSHAALFGLVLLAQESLFTPPEVRQHIFSHEKFGRVLILEMASVLKNFKFPLLPNADWYQVAPQQDNWLMALEQVCLKLARYDVTWEYRKEYQDVPVIAARYYH